MNYFLKINPVILIHAFRTKINTVKQIIKYALLISFTLEIAKPVNEVMDFSLYQPKLFK